MARTKKDREVTNRALESATQERITQSIIVVRGLRILLDTELALLYGVPTKRFNEQVKRNLARFPPDFMFQLNADEAGTLRSHFATSNPPRGGRRYAPYAFTEHGAIMAAMILNSPRAVEMSVYVVRAFVRLREMLVSNAELTKRFDELEARIAQKISSQDATITSIIKTIRELMNPPLPKKRPIGFIDLEERKK